MRVDWAIPCRYAEVHDNLATVIGAGITHLWPTELPATIGLMLAIRLIFLPDEVDPQAMHKLRVAAMAPGGGMLQQVEGDLNIGRPSVAPDENEFQGVHVPMALQFQAEVEGTYMLEITVDGHTTGVPLHVAPGPPPAPPTI